MSEHSLEFACSRIDLGLVDEAQCHQHTLGFCSLKRSWQLDRCISGMCACVCMYVCVCVCECVLC